MTPIYKILFLFVIIITLRLRLRLHHHHHPYHHHHHHHHHHLLLLLLLLLILLFLLMFIFIFIFSLSLIFNQRRSQGILSPPPPTPKGAREEKPWFRLVTYLGDKFIFIGGVPIYQGIVAAAVCYLQNWFSWQPWKALFRFRSKHLSYPLHCFQHLKLNWF